MFFILRTIYMKTLSYRLLLLLPFLAVVGRSESAQNEDIDVTFSHLYRLESDLNSAPISNSALETQQVSMQSLWKHMQASTVQIQNAISNDSDASAYNQNLRDIADVLKRIISGDGLD